ncbi:hypothetical protein TVNIR_3082 [Thioalkalivibrio nitratireducens DSM 14787]|uniref:ATP-binding protein n=1 Tax=Thioalkalivibrio nitratireducens (strain DSM 14787 / UNIQEM 213 / ALEN2) TaxID=1255043 RepID=L0DYP8_THIND|nr:hypothetical protein [Thioalkalivibrio nitratireducens]AGA34719.1 hypothetical protein TVNIR_3082 [Thioalkalivibrio nitratireducens DSM 14787]
MSEHMVDVTVHIDETIGAEAREGIQDRLRDLNGVMAASSHDDKPHLLLVEYDPERVSGQEILDTVVGTGVHAELIGL